MVKDALAQLRSADPCPQLPSYDQATLSARISTITSATDAAPETLLDIPASDPHVRHGRRMQRRALVATVCALVVAAATITYALRGRPDSHAPAAASSPAESSPAPGAEWRSFTGNAVTFRYPAAWRSYPYHWSGSFIYSLTYLSSTAIPNPCSTTHTGGNTQISCGLPATHITGNRVLIFWAQTGSPGPVADSAGTPTTLGGHAARLRSGPAGPECGHLGAATSIQAAIAMGSQYGGNAVLHMTACLGGSERAANIRDVMAMLGTLQITR